MTATLKTVVLGAAGQLGREFCRQYQGEVVPITRAEADLSKPEAIQHMLAQQEPAVVINCAAYNLVDRAEQEPSAAFATNALGVRSLALAARERGFLLVHFSTDYVFGLAGERSVPYHEGDAPGPVSVYGTSKLAGEYFVRSLAPEHLVIRTCGLYSRWGTGGKGGNFVETMLRLAREGKPIRVVNDQVLSPSSASEVAGGAIELLRRGARGLRHLTNSGHCSWFEFAQAIFQLTGVRADLAPTSSAAYGAPARRPAYSVLATSHEDTPRLTHWRDALAAYLEQRPSNG